MDDSDSLRVLFHRLNNQLGIILAHAELLANKASDDVGRARASQVVSSALEAMSTAKELRLRLDAAARYRERSLALTVEGSSRISARSSVPAQKPILTPSKFCRPAPI